MPNVSINLNLPQKDLPFIRQMSRRLGWDIIELNSLWDPETNQFLNEETMQAIREAEAGNMTQCNNMEELLAQI